MTDGGLHPRYLYPENQMSACNACAADDHSHGRSHRHTVFHVKQRQDNESHAAPHGSVRDHPPTQGSGQ